ncbi:alpha-L-rhamnosidase C-terminal domain-containing protein [Streptomyces sp. NPDC051677]|uniref:alpha-L-rhamnosidase C-terminal domain-containing protein n=1 Tax=Streptomyces sp. NPDC051677 TaxID=3365669 RepID=UPI0037D2B0BC
MAPHPGAGLTSAGASLATPYGTASVDWSLSGTTLTVDVSLPPGTTGRFSTPEGWRCSTQADRLGPGAHRLILHSDDRPVRSGKSPRSY